MADTVSENLCPQCRNRNPSDAVFCEACGERLPPAAAARAPIAPVNREAPLSGKPTVLIPAEPEQRPLADLTVVGGKGARYGTRFPLGKERQKIGRGDGMEIRLADETVSREHASIWWEDGSFHIQDEVSKSGTKINGQKIVRQTLADNDTIEIGKTKMAFRIIPGTPMA